MLPIRHENLVVKKTKGQKSNLSQNVVNERPSHSREFYHVSLLTEMKPFMVLLKFVLVIYFMNPKADRF